MRAHDGREVVGLQHGQVHQGQVVRATGSPDRWRFVRFVRERTEMEGASERGDALVEALELKMLNDDPSIINVRLAGELRC